MIPVQERFPIKRLMILCISVLFFGLSSLGKGVRRLARRSICGTCVVLYYHAIRSEHRPRFARQMDILLRCARPVRADRQELLSPGVHQAVVTFDDGYENVIDNALPELEKRRIPFTLFIITDALGKVPYWLTGYRDPAWYGLVMSADRLRSLSSELITVGSHTVTHPALPALSAENARRELSESRAQLESILNRRVRLFSFPYGAYNAKLLEWSRGAGYERVFSTLPTLAFVDPVEFVTGRVPVEPTDWTLEFRLKLSGAYRWMPAVFSLKRKLRCALWPRSRGHAQAAVSDCSPSASPGVRVR